MFYYISTNSWNLLESFVSESISPFSFYQVRGYGNNLSRYLDGTNERANYLILSTKEINGDYVLRVNDEILDKSNIAPVKNSETRSHTDNFGENNVKCLIAKGIYRFVPHSSAGGF